jgi:ribonuclease E
MNMADMLFNAKHDDELRVAILDNKQLTDLLLEENASEQKKANIYKAKVTRVEPSLEAAFVDFGQERHGFLPLKEISSEYFRQGASKNDDQRQPIKELVKEGQTILVQVEKEERGNKGAALSTFISLAGSYLVLMPNNVRAGGISRRIEGEDRDKLKETMSQLDIPKEMGVIVRTAGVGRSVEELQWDLNYLLKLWNKISEAVEKADAPALIHRESDVAMRALRDHFRSNIKQIIIDDADLFKKVRDRIAVFQPDFVDHVKLYKAKQPLFSKYAVESQIQSAFQREIRLPSGGSIVIDRSEALIAIDINSAQATKGSDIEETAFLTNLEAADEIARQLRIRDLGGLVVVDFIDMSSTRHQRDVEERLSAALTGDRARVQMGRISRFGLLEMSRQRLRASIADNTQELCPRCHGRGSIRSVKSLATSIIRMIDHEAAKNDTVQVYAQVPVAIASYLLNEKRQALNVVETHRDVQVYIIPNPHMHTPEYEVERIKGTKGERKRDEIIANSYELITAPKAEAKERFGSNENEVGEIPLVSNILPDSQAPKAYVKTAKKASLLSRIVTSIFGETAEEEPPVEPPKHHRRPQHHRQRQGGNNNRRNNTNRQGNSNQKPRQAQSSDSKASDNRDETKTRQTNRRSTNNRNQNQNKRQRPAGDNRQAGGQAGEGNKRTQGGGNNRGPNRQRQRQPNRDNAASREARENKPQTNAKPQAEVKTPAPIAKKPDASKPQAAPAPVKKPVARRPRRKPVDQGNFKQVETSSDAKQAAPMAKTDAPRGQKRPAQKAATKDAAAFKMVETKSEKSE